MSLNDLKAAQSQDPHLHAAIKYLAANPRHFDVKLLGPLARQRKRLYLFSDGILYWKQYVVVQQQLRSFVLQLCHNHPSSGRFGIDRTWARFSNTYYWLNAKSDVTSWIKSCETCNAFNPPTGRYHKAPLQTIASSERFELVCYDLAGPFMPTTPLGNTHALTLVDHFTKWSEVIPFPDTSASTIARAIHDQWSCRCGLMKQLHNDGAPNVRGYLMQEVCSLLSIGKSEPSRLHPQVDGLSEAMVKQVKVVYRNELTNMVRTGTYISSPLCMQFAPV